METRNLPLRILYTINSSPQYILARSSSHVPTFLVPQVQSGSHYDKNTTADVNPKPETRFHYATTSLKTCLDAICRSSPELVQDFTRDFSVYVLDPLESNSAPAPVNISSSSSAAATPESSSATTEASIGVAVGLGLMSWALLADESDSVTVTGTLIKLGTGQEALEVIFALRETAAMQEASLPAALRSWGLPPEPASKLSRVHASKSHRESKHPSKPIMSSVAINKPVPSSQRGFQDHVNSSGSSSRLPLRKPYEPPSSTPTQCQTEASSSADMTTLATIASIQMRKRSKPKKPVRPPLTNPSSEADRLMLAEETYIGPVRKKGRPARSSGVVVGEFGGDNAVASSSRSIISSKSGAAMNDDKPTSHMITDADNTVSLLSSTSSAPNATIRKSRPMKKSLSSERIPLPFVTTPLIRSPRDPTVPFPQHSSEPTTLLDILAYLSASSSSNDPGVQNAALLAALNAIDSTPGASGSTAADKATNPALVNALKDLLSAVSKQGLPPRITLQHSQSQANSDHRTHLPDDEIVILDKENVNPSAFRRRTERDRKLAESNPTSALEDDRAHHTRTLSNRSNESSNTAASVSNSMTRKRTLSEFMDEREAGDKGKGREREWAERRDAHRHAHASRRNSSTELSANRHYPRVLASDESVSPKRLGTTSHYRTGMEPWTSPPKPKGENRSLTLGSDFRSENSQQRPFTIPDSPQGPRISASSPVRSKSFQSRRYVVPAWARTETSTQPRLSEEAQKALEEAEERKKREEKEVGRRKTANRGDRKRRIAKSLSPERPAKLREASIRQDELSKSIAASALPPPIAVQGDYPIFAMTVAIQDRIAALSPSSPSHPESLRLIPPTPNKTFPSTPPRKRPGNSYSPGEDDSLFTPMSLSHGANVLDIATSPFCPKNGRVFLSRKSNEALLKTPGGDYSGAIKKDVESEESDKGVEDALNRELDNALEDLDLPSSSLPIANSDTASETPSNLDGLASGNQSSDDDDDLDEPKETTTKQHWVGLPPSSPPPPTSPILMPQDDESDSFSDDLELPIATSDAEECTLDSDYTTSPSGLTGCTDDELAEYLTNSDFASLFPGAVDRSALDSNAADSGMDIFDQYTNHNAQSDHGSQALDVNADGGDMFQNGLADFDFTEFWETFKPLVQDNHDSLPGTDMEYGQNNALDIEDFNHTKLAEDVHALFSGCLV